MDDLVLKELVRVTGWRWYKMPNAYLLRCHFKQLEQIKNIDVNRDRNCFRILDPAFDEFQIVFMVDSEHSMAQYWTRAGILHRPDKPAKIIWSAARKYLQNNWYWNGVLHREGGPAIEEIIGYNYLDISQNVANHHVMEAERIDRKWRRYGVDGSFPYPSVASLYSPRWMVHRETGLLDQPDDQTDAVYAPLAVFNWSYNPEQTGIQPSMIMVREFKESRTQGVLNQYRGEFGDTRWIVGKETIEFSPDEDAVFLPDDWISGINFQGAPEFANVITDFAIQTELMDLADRRGDD